MAGGAGTRLWPASHTNKPKQLMKLAGGKTLLFSTLERAFSLKLEGYLLIVTHESQVEGCLQECYRLPAAHRKKVVILGEPEARNTAPALALAARWISLNASSEDSLLVMAADHLIKPLDTFYKDVQMASDAADEKNLVTFGILPDYPSTGYGYIEASVNQDPIRKVLSFKEKPDHSTASEFLIKGNYFWNSGMFAYRVDTFNQELEKHSPEVFSAFLELKPESFPLKEDKGVRYLVRKKKLDKVYAQSPSISIDYALMEKSQSIRMVCSRFNWNDVGSWDSIADEKLTEQSLVFGDVKDNFVFSDIPVALKGVDNLIIVVKNGTLMICPRGKSQLVKPLVEEVGEKGHRDLL